MSIRLRIRWLQRWLCWVKRRGCARSGSRLLALRLQKICTRCTRWKAEWKICTFIIGTEKAPAALWRREQLTGTPIAAAQKDGTQRYATLEFVMGDNEEQFLQDAAALHVLLKEE